MAQAAESAATTSSPSSKASGLVCAARSGPTISAHRPNTAPDRRPLPPAPGRQQAADGGGSGCGSSRRGRADQRGSGRASQPPVRTPRAVRWRAARLGGLPAPTRPLAPGPGPRRQPDALRVRAHPPSPPGPSGSPSRSAPAGRARRLSAVVRSAWSRIVAAYSVRVPPDTVNRAPVSTAGDIFRDRRGDQHLLGLRDQARRAGPGGRRQARRTRRPGSAPGPRGRRAAARSWPAVAPAPATRTRRGWRTRGRAGRGR